MGPDPYRVYIRRRVRLAGTLYVPGTVLNIDPSRLAVAATLCTTGSARPLDDRTARDIELYVELRRVIPAA